MEHFKAFSLVSVLLGGMVTVLSSQAEVSQFTNLAEVSSKPKSPELTQLELQQIRQAKREAAARAEAEAEARIKAEQNAKERAGVNEKAKQAEASAAREKLLNDASSLMNAGKPSDAYALLLPSEFERAGEVRFDYLLGIAALDSGKPDKATLALERVLAVDPNYAGARLDMARAYYQLGDLARAKTEFEMVMTQNPPEVARVTIKKYLDAIRAYEEAKKTRFTAYLEGVAGRDSNINGATSQAQIPVPAFGNLVFTLNQSSLETPDSYVGFAGGLEVNHSLDSVWGMYAGSDLRTRTHASHNEFNNVDWAVRAGLSYTRDDDVFRFGLIGDQYRLGVGYEPEPYRYSSGFTGEWRRPASPSDQLTFFGQFTQNRFVTSGMTVQDHDLTLIGASWLHVLANGRSVVYGSFFGGRETAVAPATLTNPNGGRPDGNKTMTGLRVGSQITRDESWDYLLGVGIQTGKYDRENLAFMAKRSDTLWDLNMGVNWHWDKSWIVRPQLTVSSNKSNIPVYSFDRNDFSVVIRRDFK
ncbi:MAG: porin family protein [Sideroxydans sp.]